MKKSEVLEMIKEEIVSVLNEADFNFGEKEFGRFKPKEDRVDKYLFTVKNDQDGIDRIKRAKDALRPYFKFRIRGRHDNRKELLGDKYRKYRQNDVPLADAQYLAIYVDPKQ